MKDKTIKTNRGGSEFLNFVLTKSSLISVTSVIDFVSFRQSLRVERLQRQSLTKFFKKLEKDFQGVFGRKA